MGEGAETITATETDAAGNSSSTSADISVDTVAPDSNALTITTPIAGDNVVNDAEATEGFSITGTGSAGNTVVVTDAAGNEIGTT
ncbi:hypothetical protein ACTFDF_05910, partial [Campylobacter jejuni]